MGFFQYIGDWINGNPGKAAGAFLGFILGILVFTIGPGKTLLIVLFVAIGYFIGKSKDENISIVEMVARLFRRD
jgi:uncharacterized membrane protein